MEHKDRNFLVAAAAVIIGGCICAIVAALRWCSVGRTSYFTLAGAAPASS